MISEEAVEAAAKVVADHVGYGWVDADHREVAREILEAAAAHMLRGAKAEAWDEALDEAAGLYMDQSSADHMKTTNPYRGQA